MSTPNPNDPGYSATDPNVPADPPRRGNSSPLLWVLLLIALLALGWWWFGKQPAATPPGESATIDGPVATDAASNANDKADKPVVADAKRPANKNEAKPRPKPATGITRDPAPLASNEAPRYPSQALRSGVEGSVSVRIEVDANGVPTDVKVVERSGERSRELDRAVIDTARRWRFEPAMENGKPVAGAVVLPVEFKRG